MSNQTIKTRPQDMTAADRLFWANRTIEILIDEDDECPEDAVDYGTVCDGRDDCITLVSVNGDDYDDHDQQCQACWDSTHFYCRECDEEFHHDEEHEQFKGYCVDCGCSKHQEKGDELWTEIEDIAGSWSGDDDEIMKLKKLLAYVKKLSK